MAYKDSEFWQIYMSLSSAFAICGSCSLIFIEQYSLSEEKQFSVMHLKILKIVTLTAFNTFNSLIPMCFTKLKYGYTQENWCNAGHFVSHGQPRNKKMPLCRTSVFCVYSSVKPLWNRVRKRGPCAWGKAVSNSKAASADSINNASINNASTDLI